MKYDLRTANTKKHILEALGVPQDVFGFVEEFDQVAYEQNSGCGVYKPFAFERHTIPKKNPKRGHRIVWEPAPFVIDSYKSAARRLGLFFELATVSFPHQCCFGYVAGRNIRENASVHLGARHLLKCDLKDFFPSISKSRLTTFLTSAGIHGEALTTLTTFLTLDDHLALGLPTSPVVANAYCAQLDHDLHNLATSKGARYSRYADDLSFSSDGDLPNIPTVESVVTTHGFQLAPDKTRVSKLGQNHYVTGLSISDPNQPHVPRSMKRKLRQELYYCEKFGIFDHLDRIGMSGEFEQGYINHLDGIVRYVAYHQPALATKIVPAWKNALLNEGHSVSFEPKNQRGVGFVFHIDETEFDVDGTKFLALGICVTQHQELINQAASSVLDDFLASPFSDGKLEAIKKNGLHYQDATEDLKMKYIEAIQELPLKGYIVFAEMADDSLFGETYLRLLNHVIKRRLMASDGRFAAVCLEQNNKVAEQDIRDAIRAAWSALRKENNRCPAAYSVRFAGKEEIGISTPDFLLGVFRKFITSGPAKSPLQREHLLFERVRDKIRLISNADSGQEFGRRNILDFKKFKSA